MRRFIDLVENSGRYIPDSQKYVTDALINRILTTLCFVPHSSEDSLQEWYDDMVKIGGLAGGKELEDAVNTSEFREAFTDWMRNKRSKYVNATMQEIGPDTAITRAMFVPRSWLKQLTKPIPQPIKLGVFWTTGQPSAYHAPDDIRKNGVEVIITSHLKDVEVDWKNTFESRFDWINGDEEQEIHLQAGSLIRAVAVEYDNHNVTVDPTNTFTA